MAKRKKSSSKISPESIREQEKTNSASFLLEYFTVNRRNELLMILELEDAIAHFWPDPEQVAEDRKTGLKLYTEEKETIDVTPFRPLNDESHQIIHGSDQGSIAPVPLTEDQIVQNMSGYLNQLMREAESGTRGILTQEEVEKVLQDALYILADQLRPDDPGKVSRHALATHQYTLPESHRQRC